MADRRHAREAGLPGPIILLARIFFALVFIISSLNHYNGQDLPFAITRGVPMARIVVPVVGLLPLLGGISILLGHKAKLGAWLLVIFLVPVTPVMHNFWAVSDPAMHAAQMGNFLRNISFLGSALLIAHFGAGPWSLDAAANKRAIPDEG
jgi:putative oxidoreductase